MPVLVRRIPIGLVDHVLDGLPKDLLVGDFILEPTFQHLFGQVNRQALGEFEAVDGCVVDNMSLITGAWYQRRGSSSSESSDPPRPLSTEAESNGQRARASLAESTESELVLCSS